MKRIALFLIVVLLLHSQYIASQITKTGGVNGANMTSFVQKGTKIFAGSTNGFVYVSSDNGANWNKLSKPDSLSANNYVTKFHVVGNRLFAGMFNSLCYTDNDGLKWSKGSLISSYVTGIVSSNTKLFISTASGLYTSVDTGKTFTQFIDTVITSTLNLKSIYKSGNDIYIGVQKTITNYYLLKSTDNGLSWKIINVPDVPQSILKSGTRDFIGATFQTYYSDDGWLTNTQITMPSSYGSGRNYNLFSTSSYLFIFFNYGIFRSSNNGNTWIELPIKKAVTSLTEVGTSLFATTSGGVFYSNDYGNTWLKRDNNITEIVAKRAFDLNSKLILLTQNSGIFVSDDNGMTWHPSNTGIGTEPLSDLIIGDNSTLYTLDDVRIIYKSYDKGATWIADSSFFTRIISIAYSKGKILGCDGNGSLYKSDTGNIVMTLTTALTGVNFLKANNQRVIAFTNTGVITTSDDAGLNWTNRFSGGSFSASYSFYFSAEGNSILANSNNQAYYSSDNGNTWIKSLNKPNTQGALVRNSVFYIGSADSMNTSTNATVWTVSTSYFKEPKAYVNPLLLKGGNLFFAKATDGIYYQTGFSGVNNYSKTITDILLYPNPAKDYLGIRGVNETTLEFIKLYDFCGNEIQFSITDNKEIDISKLPQGIYFVRLGDSDAKVLKFVKME